MVADVSWPTASLAFAALFGSSISAGAQSAHRDGIARGVWADVGAVEHDDTPVAPGGAEDDPAQRVDTGAHEAEDADDLTGVDGERDVAQSGAGETIEE